MPAASLDRCARLQARLPASLGPGLARRRVTPASPLTAAWGDPAVTLRCGARLPAVPPTSFVAVVDGQRWLTLPAGGGTRAFAVGRPVLVEVFLPGQAQGADVLAALTPLLAALGSGVRASPVR